MAAILAWTVALTVAEVVGAVVLAVAAVGSVAAVGYLVWRDWK